jgi:signal transduction histidine kinase
VFPLLRYFSIASAVALLGATALILTLYRHTLLEHVLEHGEISNVAMAQSLWTDVRPVVGLHLNSTGTSSGEQPASASVTARLRRIVGERIDGRTVFDVKIINLEGRAVFSTQESQIGTDYSRAPGLMSALSGKAASELIRRDDKSAPGHPVSDADILSSAVPMFGKSGDVEAVVEIHDNVGAVTYYLRKSLIRAGFVIFGLFGLVYLLLFLIVWRAGRVMRDQHRQILDNQAALREVNDELELRVAERSLQLRETQEDLNRKQRLATLGQLIGSVGHDLRNPLGVIRNSLAAIAAAGEQVDLNLKRPMERCERSIRRCEGIIDDLLDHTRVRELKLVTTAVDPWLESVLDEQTLPEGIVLRRDLAAAGVEIPMDADRFRRVIVNLFDNACQAMAEHGERPDGETEHALTVATRVLGEEVEISFSDTGSGIPPEAMARIFEPLFTTKAGGIGLGLPMVKQVVEQHGGQIGIDCPVGRGTQARLRLPLRRAAEAAA